MLPVWRLDAAEALDELGSSEQGLSAHEVAGRRAHHGVNVIAEKAARHPALLFVRQLGSPLIVTLLLAAGLTYYLREYVETIVILVAVIVNAALSAYQEYSAERTIESLKRYVAYAANVIRGGDEISVPSVALVPGDIVVVRTGEKVLADMRILRASGASADESLLTGESVPVRKQTAALESDAIAERTNCLFAGTLLVTGTVRGVVYATGAGTEFGKIAASIAETRKTTTPVQRAVSNASWYIFALAILVIVGLVALGVYRGEDFFDMLVLAAAIAVGAVPESLPIALTVVLAIGVAHIARRGGLVNKLDAAETLGSATLILTDKTGTLTRGQLTIEEIVPLSGTKEEQLLATAFTNLEAVVHGNGAERTYAGNPFEVALLRAMHARGLETESAARGESLMQFSSAHKYSAAYDGAQTVFLGAPDVLLAHAHLPDEERVALEERIRTESASGKRLVGLATKEGRHHAPDGVILRAIFVASDEIRDDVARSIARIRESGVAVKVISGDLPGTVRHIAAEVGIEADASQSMTGSELQSLSDGELAQRLPGTVLFARMTPEDKLRIGRLYQASGEIVAMTGDGVNDAPVLRAMDIGISLGSGTDVAKSAADIVLIKDSFTTIAESIHEGRVLKANIRKVFTYLMSNSLDSVFVVSGALLAGVALPLTALQILWVNMVTGTLPALAFAYDTHAPVAEQLRTPIFDRTTKVIAFGVGTFSSLLLLGLYALLASSLPDETLARSVFFLCFSTYVLAISYSFVRLDQPIFRSDAFGNWRLNAANAVGLALVGLAAYSPLGQRVFELMPVPPPYLLVVLLWCALNVALIEVAKHLLRRA